MKILEAIVLSYYVTTKSIEIEDNGTDSKIFYYYYLFDENILLPPLSLFLLFIILVRYLIRSLALIGF